jgi:hypothetical protein
MNSFEAVEIKKKLTEYGRIFQGEKTLLVVDMDEVPNALRDVLKIAKRLYTTVLERDKTIASLCVRG